ncbi:MAG TPA: neutral zinc metallopeptidase [Vicinamibacteria bacterium]|nr:neutral zinc metallopeptidase [Vicinamibacteria bacterium]
MRWQDRRESGNVEDRRGQRPRRASLGIGGLLAVLAISYFAGVDPRQMLSLLGGLQSSVPAPDAEAGRSGPPTDQLGRFASVVLASTEDVWTDVFRRGGRSYEEPRLVLFAEMVDSACGTNSSAVGPFYCPGDAQVYLDLSFFRELESRFGAPGDFAQAYVIAHEVGHHVQNLLGISDRVSQLQRRGSEVQANALSVRLELQADCLAGVWGHFANAGQKLIEPGDVEEGLAAAAAIGDDRLQQEAGRRAQPESWTHGSSADRVRWFKQGLASGTIEACDSFRSAS